MNLNRLEKMFELTKEILLTNKHNDSKEAEIIYRLNDELWNCGYKTWVTMRTDGKPCLSVRPRSERRSTPEGE